MFMPRLNLSHVNMSHKAGVVTMLRYKLVRSAKELTRSAKELTQQISRHHWVLIEINI